MALRTPCPCRLPHDINRSVAATFEFIGQGDFPHSTLESGINVRSGGAYQSGKEDEDLGPSVYTKGSTDGVTSFTSELRKNNSVSPDSSWANWVVVSAGGCSARNGTDVAT